jgi:eukaryotic-like serine/threonine-protein kinase
MSETLQQGGIFAGRYRVVRYIATGAMGAVYEVVHIDTDRRRALKVMHAYTLQSDDLRDRFKREAKVAANIESEFIVDVFDAGVDVATDMPFLVMELLRGEELGKRLKRVGRFSPEETLVYLQQTALALDKTHQASIIHRDLKPANLFLTQRDDGSPRIKVLDFGIAKLIADSNTRGAGTGTVGTPLYMSPEQFRGATRLSPAVDIYALGVITYTFLVGHEYWSQEAEEADSNIFAFAAKAANGPQEPPCARALRRGVQLPPSFDAWFARAIALNPTDRFATATMATSALAEVFGMAPLIASHVSGQVLPENWQGPRASSNPRISGETGHGKMATIREATTGNPMVKPPSEQRKGSIIAAFALGLVVIVGVGLLAMRRLRPPPNATAERPALASQTAEAPAPALPTASAAVAVAVDSAVALVEPVAPLPTLTASAARVPPQGPIGRPGPRSTASPSGKGTPAKTAAEPSTSAPQLPKYSRE